MITRAARGCVPAALCRVLLFAACAMTGCSDDGPRATRPEYATPASAEPVHVLVLGIHPLHNPGRLDAMYGPLVAAVNAAVPGVTLRIEASRDYAEYERKLREGRFDLALPNPYQTVVVAAARYRVFGKVARDEDFRGLIIRRRDSTVSEPDDLRGAAFSCPARTAVAACMLPLLWLHQQGLDVAHELEVREVGSQESSILNVVQGRVAAGATWPPPWRAFQKDYPELAAQLEVLWQTDTLPNNSLMARHDVDDALVGRVAQALFALSASASGRRLLDRAEIAGFEPANALTYAPVGVMLDRYRAAIGDVR